MKRMILIATLLLLLTGSAIAEEDARYTNHVYLPFVSQPQLLLTETNNNVLTITVPVTLEPTENPFTDVFVEAVFSDGYRRVGYFNGTHYLVKRYFSIDVELSVTIKVIRGIVVDQTYTQDVSINHVFAQGLFDCGKLHNDGTEYLSMGSCGSWGEWGAGVPEDMLNSANFSNTVNPRYADAYTFIDEAEILGFNSFYVVGMGIGGDSDVSPYINVDLSGSPDNDNLHFDTEKMDDWEEWMIRANEKSIVIHLLFGESEVANKMELDSAHLGIERKTLYREFVARFGYLPGVYFDVTEEYDSELRIPIPEILEWACYLQNIDSTITPITVHHFWPYWETSYFPLLESPCIDLTSLQVLDTEVSHLPDLFHQRRIIPVHISEPATLPWQEHCNRFMDFMINNGAGLSYYKLEYNTHLSTLLTISEVPCSVQ